MTITATDIKAGMIVEISGERFDVEEVAVKWGAVQVRDWHGAWRGLGMDESVRILGYYNPE